jgi:hypothetical protein
MILQTPVRYVPGSSLRRDTVYTDLSFFIRDYWACPSSSILKDIKGQKRFGNWICFHPHVRWLETALLGSLETSQFNHWTPFTWTRKEIPLPKRCILLVSFRVATGLWTESKKVLIASVIHIRQSLGFSLFSSIPPTIYRDSTSFRTRTHPFRSCQKYYLSSYHSMLYNLITAS